MAYSLEYSDSLPDWVGGKCYYPIIPLVGKCRIVIRTKYKDDKGLLAHEVCHYKQYKRNLFHTALYALYKPYRYKCELEAYKEQIREYEYTNIGQCGWIVNALEKKYNLGITREQIEIDIIQLLGK